MPKQITISGQTIELPIRCWSCDRKLVDESERVQCVPRTVMERFRTQRKAPSGGELREHPQVCFQESCYQAQLERRDLRVVGVRELFGS